MKLSQTRSISLAEMLLNSKCLFLRHFQLISTIVLAENTALAHLYAFFFLISFLSRQVLQTASVEDGGKCSFNTLRSSPNV